MSFLGALGIVALFGAVVLAATALLLFALYWMLRPMTRAEWLLFVLSPCFGTLAILAGRFWSKRAYYLTARERVQAQTKPHPVG